MLIKANFSCCSLAFISRYSGTKGYTPMPPSSRSLYFGFAVRLVAAFLDDGHAVVVELFPGLLMPMPLSSSMLRLMLLSVCFQRYQYAAAIVSGGWRFEWITNNLQQFLLAGLGARS